ncbi:MAG: hypothetical protein FJW23_07910 [Acidimicrobiia bacterium]|nr:hypothetical protein [Acidimicrobiia bacterium]
MKFFRLLGTTLGGLVLLAAVLLGAAATFGFNPGTLHPGLWLTGEVATEKVTDWDWARKARGLTGIQTRDHIVPFMAFSINGSRFIYKGKMYLGSGYPTGAVMPEKRHWNKNIVADPRVRVRIDGKLYDGKLTYLTDEALHDEICRQYGSNLWMPGFYIHLWEFEHTPSES